MLPTTFEQCNTVYGKPSDMTDDECMSLPVWKGKDTNGFPVIISCWKLSYEDLQEIQRTGCVWLNVTGTALPPVSVQTENPFEPFAS